MVCSQAYSQAPSHCMLPKEHSGLAPYSVDQHCTASKIIEANQLGNAAIDGDVRSFKGSTFCVTSGNGNAVSPLESSWVQRLIPSHSTRLEQSQVSYNLKMENHGMDNRVWKENAAEYEFSLYENSKRSKQEVYIGTQTFMGTNSRCYDGAIVNAATNSPVKALEALQPDVIPVVESLLSGCSRKVTGNEPSLTEANKLGDLSKCTGCYNQIKQTVHFHADERSRISCSSIAGLNSWSAVPPARHLLPVKPLHLGKTCFNSLRLDPEFPLNSTDTSTRLKKLDPIYGGKDRQTSTNLSRGCVNLSQTRPATNSFCTGPLLPINHASSAERHETVKNSLLHRSVVTYRAEAVESFSKPIFAQANASIDHVRHLKTSDRDCWHAKECLKCEDDPCFRSKAFIGSGSASEGEGCLGHNFVQDGPPGVSNMVSLHHGINRVHEEAGGFPSYHMDEEHELGSSHRSHEEQAGTSSSFSFHRLSDNSEQFEAVMGKGVCILCPNTVSSEDLVQQSRCLCEDKNGDFAETTRPGMFLHDSSTLQTIGGGEAGIDYMARSQCSPFFGTETLTELTRYRPSVEDDISPYKASWNNARGVLLGSAGTAQANVLGGGHIFFGNKVGLRNAEMEVDGTSTICHRTDHIGSCLKRPGFISVGDQASRTVSSAIGNQFCSANKQIARTGQSAALDGGTSEGREVAATVVKQRMWLQRWDTTQTRKAQGVSKMNRERRIFQGTLEGPPSSTSSEIRHSAEKATDLSHSKKLPEIDCCRSHCSRGFPHSYYEDFDFRSTKRVCHGKRSGLQFEAGKAVSKFDSEAPLIENNENGGVSTFMKQFFTPSPAAMAVMGTTARQVYATQPFKRGLFGAWASNASITRPPSARAELSKNFMTEPKSHNVFSKSAPKHSSTPMMQDRNV